MLGPTDLVFSSAPVAHIPFRDRLAPAREAGFSGVSLLPSDIWSLEQEGWPARAIAGLVADNGLELAEMDCIGLWLPSQQSRAIADALPAFLRELTPARVIPTAARVGARSVTVIEMVGVNPSPDEACEAFATICDMAADHGLLVHLEFLPFGGIPDLATAWGIVAASGRPNGGLTIDCWHLFRSGSTLEQLSQVPGRCIGSVQISDAPARPGDDLLIETMTGRLLPGEGDLDLEGVVRTLDRIGSAAPVGVEVFSGRQDGVPIGKICASWAQAARNVVEMARGDHDGTGK